MKYRIATLLSLLLLAAFVFAPLASVRADEYDPMEAVYAEIARLEAAAAEIPANYKNPHPASENFAKLPVPGKGPWQYLNINGGGLVSVNDRDGVFHNSSATITRKKQLQLGQVFDTEFAAEQPEQLYNNVFLIGFGGYVPTRKQDVVIEFKMKVDEGFYGSTGFFIEPQDTFAPDGNFQLPADWFGVSYSGPENYNAGLSCSYIISWVPLSQQPVAANPFQWNDYKITLRMLNQTYMEAALTVNGEQVCSQQMPRFPVEVQIWSDNYLLTADETGITIGFNNQETPQSVLFDDISVRARKNK